MIFGKIVKGCDTGKLQLSL